mmetsp:Transcript_41562/g.111454  ORF Transcript_41562/g.111454 Transcript_41562/m.111454 type:complete len:113 (+) Transcript_41562:1223-1561(+)
MQCMLLVLIQDFDVPSPKTILDLFTKFARVMCFVAVQTKRAMSVKMEIRTFFGSISLAVSWKQTDNIRATDLNTKMHFSFRIFQSHCEISDIALSLDILDVSFVYEMKTVKH